MPPVPERQPEEPVLAIDGLGFTYAGAGEPTLSGVSLRIEAGEFVVLAGQATADLPGPDSE